MPMTKLVNVYAQIAIRNITPPIYGTHKNIIMNTGDILKCICKRARVEEILLDGSVINLTMKNYYTDNGAGLDASARKSSVNEDESPATPTTSQKVKEVIVEETKPVIEPVVEENVVEETKPVIEPVVEENVVEETKSVVEPVVEDSQSIIKIVENVDEITEEAAKDETAIDAEKKPTTTRTNNSRKKKSTK